MGGPARSGKRELGRVDRPGRGQGAGFGASGRGAAAPRPRARRDYRPPPQLAAPGADLRVELDIRVRPGSEPAATSELLALGARSVESRGRGELRVVPGGPIRGLLDARRSLAVYAVLPLPGTTLRDIDRAENIAAALELAGIAMSVARRVRFDSFRVTAAPDVPGDRAALGRLAGHLGRRLRLRPVAIQPDLIVIVRSTADGLEIAMRLPIAPAEPDEKVREPDRAAGESLNGDRREHAPDGIDASEVHEQTAHRPDSLDLEDRPTGD